MDNTKSILVVAPHADDEAFGCGGTIAKWTEQGARADLVVMAVGIHTYDPIRVQECSKACDMLGFTEERHLFPGKESLLDTLPRAEIVTQLDRILNEHQYNYVLLPYPSHHQDHKVTCEATIASLRLGAHHPCNVLMYEYTYPDYSISGGKFYVDISRTINKKLAAIAFYRSWVKQYPHPASVEAAENLAVMRGMAIQARYAEMFHVVQLIGD